ncbi:RagB/SusD family nutrient uptake outer membrane protein [Rhizosphaericola mali]|uniref:RagB/SusD family nutrient uptake outer membrane protein n=1 Tax=Rhizosphaericola mali TaxID=2545455 RepID=A0A5P2G1R5_9BACT|nr:RagB/SusD family nutrient uptake outer membrane protein [Rhizosphaericola mali]QES88648.1 RagB/SusD family nutrient uptake outer membrane protein [Rhizosphaericola mali]
MKFFKNIFNTCAATAILGLVATSCSKKLDQSNPNLETTETFWKDSSDALQGINAAYAPLLLDGGYMRFSPILLDVRGDDVMSNSGWTAIAQAAKFTLGTSVADGYGFAFDAYYEGIYRCNQVIKNVPDINMDDDIKNRVLGQAYFLRGLYYFHLVNMWGRVPLPTTPAASSVDYTVTQSTEEEGWQRVEDDFTAAIPLLPTSYNNVSGSDQGELGRATQGAAMAYLGKTYLFTKQYDKAAAEFKAVIDLGVYGLMDNYGDNFTESFENNKESIFEVQFSTTVGGTVLGWQGIPNSTWAKVSARAVTYGAPNFGYTDVQLTESAYNEFLQEKSADGSVDLRLGETMFYNKPNEPLYFKDFQTIYAGTPYLNQFFAKKYENWSTKADEFDWKSGINERLMRYSDVLLMYAEAENELGNVSECANYITLVRNRAKLTVRTTEFASYSQDQMRTQISHERLLEFCLEGHRFDDIKRWGWLADPTKLAALKLRDSEFNNYIPGKEYYPIPQTEIDNNPNVTQNKTY